MIELAAFYGLAGLAIVTAGMMILSKKLVYGVLAMAAHFMITAVFYLMLSAPFLAAVQVIVYAGAIMVLFLFVVMLIGPAEMRLSESLAGQRPLGIALAALLGIVLVWAVVQGVPGLDAVGAGATESPLGAEIEAGRAGFGSPVAVGELLLRRHVFALELVSVLLLVAMIGAVLIGRVGRGDIAGEAPL